MTTEDVAIPKQVLLSAIMYNVTVVEEMVVFSQDECVYGRSTRFAFERKCNCWYLIPNECEYIMMSHIEKAHKYVCQWFGSSFEGKRGENHL